LADSPFARTACSPETLAVSSAPVAFARTNQIHRHTAARA